MRSVVLPLLCLAVMFANVDCSVNILKTFANTQTDDALYEDAQSAINNHDFNTALTDIGLMSGTYAAKAPVLRLKASAYGGLCGFDFFTFVNSFSAMGSTLLFPFLEGQFVTTTTATIDACVNAQNTMMSISATDKTNDDAMFLALISLAKMGAILSYYNGNGTATVNTGWDACAVGAVARTKGDNIPDADIREFGTGLSLALANLQAVAGSVNLGSGTTTNMQNVCASLPAGYDFCSVTDPTAFTANEIKGIRSLIAENADLGIAQTISNAPAVCPGNLSSCYCP